MNYRFLITLTAEESKVLKKDAEKIGIAPSTYAAMIIRRNLHSNEKLQWTGGKK